jgi:hypothetical protein
LAGSEARVSVTKAELLEAVMIAVPYPSHITEIDLDGETDSIRFTWRGDRFRVTEGMVETVEEAVLVGGNLAILMQAVVTRGLLAALDRKEARDKPKVKAMKP